MPRGLPCRGRTCRPWSTGVSIVFRGPSGRLEVRLPRSVSRVAEGSPRRSSFEVAFPSSWPLAFCLANRNSIGFFAAAGHGHNVDQLSPTAVSYTHLRAHETDSYLVCR